MIVLAVYLDFRKVIRKVICYVSLVRSSYSIFAKRMFDES